MKLPYDLLSDPVVVEELQANLDHIATAVPDVQGSASTHIRFGNLPVSFTASASANTGNFTHGLANAQWGMAIAAGASNPDINCSFSIAPTQMNVYCRQVDNTPITRTLSVYWMVIG